MSCHRAHFILSFCQVFYGDTGYDDDSTKDLEQNHNHAFVSPIFKRSETRMFIMSLSKQCNVATLLYEHKIRNFPSINRAFDLISLLVLLTDLVHFCICISTQLTFIYSNDKTKFSLLLCIMYLLFHANGSAVSLRLIEL